MEIKHRADLVELLKHFQLPLKLSEIGSAEGLYARDLISQDSVEHLYMVDAWATVDNFGDGRSPQSWHEKNYKEAMERIEPYKDRVTVLRGISWEQAVHIQDNSLGLVYIDCCHTYECVKCDINAYWSKLVSGGVMAFHDYESPIYGVKQAVVEFAQLNNLEIHLIPEHKAEDAGAWFRKP